MVQIQSKLNLFSYLPVDILRFIFQFFNLNELLLLDLTILNHFSRSIYYLCLNGLELFSYHFNNINSYNNNENNNKLNSFLFLSKKKNNQQNFHLFLLWLIKRKILIRTISFNIYLNDILLLIKNNFKYIHIINLENTQVDNKIFSYINKCMILNYLNLENCYFINEVGLDIFLSNSLYNLQYINLSGLPVTDKMITKLIKGYPNLQHIILSRTNITNNSIQLLLEHYPNLQTLIVDDCEDIPFDGILSIFRAITLRQLFSSNVNEQLLGTKSLRHTLVTCKYILYLFYFYFYLFSFVCFHLFSFSLFSNLSNLSLDILPFHEFASLGIIPRLVEFLSYESKSLVI